MTLTMIRLALLACVSAIAVGCGSTNVAPAPPVATKIPHETTVHGMTLHDDYFWLREKENPKVIEYLKAENAYTAAVMKPTEALQANLYQEMVSRIQEDDREVPYQRGAYTYWPETKKGKQYPTYLRRDAHGEARITLDPNDLSKDHKFVAAWSNEPSDDGNLLAYSLDFTGFRQFTTFIKDLRTGKVVDTIARGKNACCWAADNKTLFYLAEDESTKRAYQLWRHTTGQSDDQLVYEEKDPEFELDLMRSDDEHWIVFNSNSFTSTEARLIPAFHPDVPPRVVAPRAKDREYNVYPHGKDLFIRVNDTGRNFRLVKAPIDDPSAGNWKEVIPHRADVMLEDVHAFKNHLVIAKRQNALPAMLIMNLGNGEQHDVTFPEPAYDVAFEHNEVFDTDRVRLTYSSFVTPKSVYDYDMVNRKLDLLKRTAVLSGYDAAKYEMKRVEATASDGTKVPMTVVWRKDKRTPNAPQPMLLEGYGSYGYPLPESFDSTRFSLIDRGVIYAMAHPRGGGEYGKTWYDAGKMLTKKNTFTDFIACAEHLIHEGYTSSDKLIITGGSAGGLLMGATVNMRPDLFKAVVPQVPWVDVINSMMDESLPLTVTEYQEWGNPHVKEQFDYMLAYSPYDNVKAQHYPDMFIETSLNDSQVMYWEPAKLTAKLRATKTDNNTLLLKARLEPAGHGGSSGRYDRLKEKAFTYAFMLREWNITR